MKAIHWIGLVVVLAVALAVGSFLFRAPQPTAPVQPAQETKPAAATVEARVGLPRVLTLYQPEDGESDLAVFVSNELNKEAKGKATFRLVNVEAEPQLAALYGVDDTPAVVFLTSSGRLYRKHNGYLDKKAILAIIARIKN